MKMQTLQKRILSWQREFQVGETVPECDVYMLTKSVHSNVDDFDEGDIGERIEEFEFYVLKDVPLSEIEEPRYYVDEERVDEYLEMNPETAPPIVLSYYSDGSYLTIDGGHRITVALKRKQATIKAFVGKLPNM